MHISSVVTFSVAKTEVGEMGISALFLPLLPYSIIYLKLPKNFIFTNGLFTFYLILSTRCTILFVLQCVKHA